MIACIGETKDERESGKTIEVVERQVAAYAAHIKDWSKVRPPSLPSLPSFSPRLTLPSFLPPSLPPSLRSSLPTSPSGPSAPASPPRPTRLKKCTLPSASGSERTCLPLSLTTCASFMVAPSRPRTPTVRGREGRREGSGCLYNLLLPGPAFTHPPPPSLPPSLF